MKDEIAKVTQILQHQFPLEYPLNASKMTAFQIACTRRNTDLIRLLHSANCKTESVDDFGRTPLHFAASAGNLEAVQYLVETCGVPLDPLTNGGETPLMKAVFFGRKNVFQYLVSRGCDLTIKNADDQHVLDIARLMADQDIITFLESQ
eukprot:CAMPEP_0115009136 /NCGR_PEP_ID=MMETSP0216-20121206/22406_1 /TAXON_ID=223996 /ORGANISM="Protocruzia adherens, Strain Boccale" /LENGTH=148 /DNA_ID=CAMNT_0002376833 /DNA_START=708 /DNA_END=1154 /DNA_ORIENTATION=-